MNLYAMIRQEYSAPTILRIKLDNEISLILESTPPTYESSTKIDTFIFSDNNPFKNKMT